MGSVPHWFSEQEKDRGIEIRLSRQENRERRIFFICPQRLKLDTITFFDINLFQEAESV